MKKSFILIFCTLFFLTSLNSDAEIKREDVLKETSHLNKGILKKAKNSIGNLNPLSYLKKRKKCKVLAERQDTVAEGKKNYKLCMNE